jgi:hypothetical protein
MSENEVAAAMAKAERDAAVDQGLGRFIPEAHASQLEGRATLKEQRDPGSMGNPEGERR